MMAGRRVSATRTTESIYSPPSDDVTRVKPFAIRNAEATHETRQRKKKEKQKAREVDASAFPTFSALGAAGGVAP